jgi:hypothetical protein
MRELGRGGLAHDDGPGPLERRHHCRVVIGYPALMRARAERGAPPPLRRGVLYRHRHAVENSKRTATGYRLGRLVCFARRIFGVGFGEAVERALHLFTSSQRVLHELDGRQLLGCDPSCHLHRRQVRHIEINHGRDRTARGGYSPVSPSIDCRMKSAWPLWRAVSSIM